MNCGRKERLNYAETQRAQSWDGRDVLMWSKASGAKAQLLVNAKMSRLKLRATKQLAFFEVL